MNRLPKVLQNEILDYLIGDRPYRKQQFNKVLAILKGHRFIRISKHWGGRTIRLSRSLGHGFPKKWFGVEVFVGDKPCQWPYSPRPFRRFEDAVRFFEFHVDRIRVLAEPRKTRSKSTWTFHLDVDFNWPVGTPRKLPSFFSES